MGQLKMKLKPIYEQILVEIGDTAAIPPGAVFKMDMYQGTVTFNFLGDKYKIDIRFAFNEKATESGNRIAVIVDFFANNDKDASMTNKGQAIKAMAYVVGCLQEWLLRYKKKFGDIELVYLKFNPKSESGGESGSDDEKGDDSFNRRDRLYRAYIDRFASKHNSSVSYSTTGGVVAKFNPNIVI